MRTRLVTNLGLGPSPHPPHYTPVVYEWGNRKTEEKTPLVERAILELFEPVDEVVVLGTEQVKNRWLKDGLLESLLERCVVERPRDSGITRGPRDLGDKVVFRVVEIESLEGQRALFQQTVADLGAYEDNPPDRVLFDVTHGFRTQPMLGMAAVGFTLSEWSRRGLANPPALQILYGAFEARKDEVAPIWDVTEFAAASRWNSALDALLRYGRADDLEALAVAEAKRARKEALERGERGRQLAAHDFVRRLGTAARELADDLALGRLLYLFTDSAPRLRELLQSEEAAAWVERLPVIESAVEALKAQVEPLCSPDVTGPAGLRATHAFAELCGRLQRFAEQAAALREGAVTRFALAAGLPRVEPGCAGAHRARGLQEAQLGALVQRVRKGSELAAGLPAREIEFAKVFDSVGGRRNDIEHLGLNNGPAKADTLRRRLADDCAALAPFASEPGEVSLRRGKRFLNLSNHPISEWSQAQLEAARALNLGEPRELEGGMPQVDPAADTAEVCELAEEIANRALAADAAGACVVGEYTLTFALVRQLQRAGVRCFASTTKRVAKSRTLPDGSTETVRCFEFQAWREYPGALAE
ncbi:MAG: CRISPR-associated DxTHG motif protein [Myxococcales bacterium]|jgi:CRISPR-associated protein Csx16